MVIIDTSIIIKIFFPEEQSQNAKSLITKEGLCAPDLILYEFSNYLIRQLSLQDEDLKMLINNFYTLGIELFVLPKKGFVRVIELGRKYQITSYDASFVVLAETLGLDFITADKKLFNKTNELKFVKPLC